MTELTTDCAPRNPDIGKNQIGFLRVHRGVFIVTLALLLLSIQIPTVTAQVVLNFLSSDEWFDVIDAFNQSHTDIVIVPHRFIDAPRETWPKFDLIFAYSNEETIASVTEHLSFNLPQMLRREPLPVGHDRAILSDTPDRTDLNAIPVEHTPLAVVIHADDFHQAGLTFDPNAWTWDVFSDWITRLDALPNQKDGFFFSTEYSFLLPFLQAGGNLTDGSFDHALIKSGLQWVKNVLTTNHPPIDPYIGIDAFANGKFEHDEISAFLDVPWVVGTNRLPPEAATSGRYILPLPGLPGQDFTGVGYVNYITIGSQSEHPFEAWAFIQWLISAQGADAVLSAGRIPVSIHPQNSAKLQQKLGPYANELLAGTFIHDLPPPVSSLNLGERYYHIT